MLRNIVSAWNCASGRPVKSQAEAPWRKPADELLDLLAKADVPLLFLLDEFPTFLKLVAKHRSRDGVEAVLNWFRATRNELKEKQVRFLVTGSIGLKSVVRNLGLAPSINEFDAHEIPPLSDEEALGLLSALAQDNDVPLDTRGQRKILKLLGANWPILLQLFISEIQESEFKKPPTTGQLEAIYLGRLANGSFSPRHRLTLRTKPARLSSNGWTRAGAGLCCSLTTSTTCSVPSPIRNRCTGCARS